MLVKFETGPIDISFETRVSITKSFNPEIPIEDHLEEPCENDSTKRIYRNCFGGEDEYIFNNRGWITDIRYDSPCDTKRETYEYDDKGRVVKIISFDRDNEIIEQSVIRYKDDGIKVFYKSLQGNQSHNEVIFHRFSERTYKKTIKFNRDGKIFDRTISFTKKERDNEIFIGTEIIADGTYSTEKKVLIVSNEN